jgi:hypothetical protein
MRIGSDESRRDFLGRSVLGAAGIVAAAADVVRAAENAEAPAAAKNSPNPEMLPNRGQPLKIFCCDFNWSLDPKTPWPAHHSAPKDWACVNPREYFDWHRDFGVNCMFCQAFPHNGHAYYPTKLGPVAPGPGSQLLPELFRLSRKAAMPFCSYFSVAFDDHIVNTQLSWRVPQTSFLAPEGPWTDLLCARLKEFLRLYPVEWINFDPFTYGKLGASDFHVRPASFVKKPFREVLGREMPDVAALITPQESLRYMREVLARQFHRMQEAIHEVSPGTKTFYNPPFFQPNEPLWSDHPLLNETDMLNAESSDDVVPWLLRIRKPRQRVMTTIIGRQGGICDPNTWKRWYAAGCDFFGYAWAIPPDFRPHPRYAKQLEITRAAYREMP